MGWKRCYLSSSVLFLRQEQLEGKVSGTEARKDVTGRRELDPVLGRQFLEI